jgi:hypothetical protein
MRPLHRVTIGRSREVRGPDGMETGMAVVIIAIVMIMALWFGMRLIPMAQTLDALSLASGPESNEIIYHAEHGRWPPADNPYMIAGKGGGLYTNNLMLDGDGAITAELTLGLLPAIGAARSTSATDSIQGSLSFRPELLGTPDVSTITFLCGYAKPVVDSAATSSANRTTLDRKILPPFCR